MIKRSMLALVGILSLSSLVRAEDIVLVDGRYLHVKLLGATESRLKVLVLDTGGEISVPWSLIREDDRKRLRIRYGYEEDETARQMFEDGVKVIMNDGAEYLGIPVEALDPQTIPEKFDIWAGGKKMSFTKAVVRAIEQQQVPALAAYSPQQLYDRKVAESNPADDDLEGQWDLARFCMATDFYEKAIVHLLKVKEIDPDYESERVANSLGRMEALAKDKVVAEAIRNAKSHANYFRFDRALADLDQILSVKDINPVLAANAKTAREYVVTQRYKYFKTVVRREYFAMLGNKTGKMARDPKLKLKDAQKELRGNLHKEIVADIAQKYGLDPKNEVEKMWAEREVFAPYVSSYGSGTFVVLGKAPGAAERDQQLQQAMARQQAQQQNKGGKSNQQGSLQAEPMKLPKPPTADEWWTNFADSATRTDWLKAYYAEQCKQMKIEGERKEDCARCGGSGTVKYDAQQGDQIAVTCPRCQGHKYDRAVRYK